MIALFFLSPHLISSVEPARQELGDSQALAANRLVTLALAAVYLQRNWFLRLTVAVNHPPDVPEAAVASYWQQRHLPPPWQHWGEAGLQALQAWERQHADPLSGFPINFFGGWQDQLEHLMIQEWLQRPAGASLPPGAMTPPSSPNEANSQSLSRNKSGGEQTFMSLPRHVTRDDIERFLQELGRMVRTSGVSTSLEVQHLYIISCVVQGLALRTLSSN